MGTVWKMNTADENRIRESVNGLELFSSHEHYLRIESEKQIDVNTLIANSYLDEEWTFLSPGRSRESRERFLDHLRAKSYLHWFRRSLKTLYGMDEELSVDSWKEYDRRIAERRNQRDFLNGVYRRFCNYVGVVQDTYWDPGAVPEEFDFFHATFRINSFLYSYSEESKDHNGNNARSLYGFQTSDLDEYVHRMEQVILQKRKEGCAALKSALAYDRGIGFDRVDKRRAASVLRSRSPVQEEDVLLFGNYIFHEICRIAEKHDIPFQIHTGLGLIHGSDPMCFEPVIRGYPGIRFVLFHGGFPWYHSIGGLLHNYPNVYADLVWLPLISPSAAVSALHEWLEVSNSIHRICWGSDCKTPEESFGASLAFRQVLSAVLTEKVQSHYLDMHTALDIARLIACDNARALYSGEEG
jgi:predicted TIM-barrel fold metal-dependent hydrolase